LPRGACPERHEILRYAQNDTKRRARNDKGMFFGSFQTAFRIVGEMPGNLREKIRKYLAKQAHLPSVGPVSIWTILFVIAPLGFILYFSFLTAGDFGRILPIFTLENYQALARPVVAEVFLRTLLFSLATTMICLLLGYPLAYFIVMYGGRWRIHLLLLVILPEWTSYLIRLYAIRMLSGRAGLINSALLSLGLISSPLGILYNPSAVVLTLVYGWLPLMVLPVYASLVGLNPSLLEASADLGATPFRRFFTVTLPLTKGGILAGIILVFIPCIGDWLVPLLMGGTKTFMAGNLVYLHFISAANIPAGSTIGVALTAIVLIIMYLCIKAGGKEATERII